MKYIYRSNSPRMSDREIFNRSLEEILEKNGQIGSKMIDLGKFNNYNEDVSKPVLPWDILGVLACPPVVKDLCLQKFRWTLTGASNYFTHFIEAYF